MAETKWQLKGDFYGNCSCKALMCPCPTSNFLMAPTEGWCKLAILFHVQKGFFDQVQLDGVKVIMVADIPGIMADGNWALGLIFDDAMTPEQQQAMGAILGGQVGGPMASAAAWIGKFLGADVKHIEFKKDGINRSLFVQDMIDFRSEGVPGVNPSEPVYWENVNHPASSRVALGKGTVTKISAFGIDFENTDYASTGVFSPFEWKVG